MFERTEALSEWATGLVECALAALFEVSMSFVAKLLAVMLRQKR